MNRMTKTAFDHIDSALKTPTALLILDDGTIYEGVGFGAAAVHVGEVCFNTSMTGYQEIMTDPSYAGQIINFTFPHIGNIGTNALDIESVSPSALGMITREFPTMPSNYRSDDDLSSWLAAKGIPSISGIDTRALTHKIRDGGAPRGVIAVNFDGIFDREKLAAMAVDWPGLKGMDLAPSVTCPSPQDWHQGSWHMASDSYDSADYYSPPLPIVALDYGCKLNILRDLTDAGFQVTVLPATSTAAEILSHSPKGIFLSNGPGDPSATASYAAAEIKILAEAGLPIFGICIGHQLIAEAFGAKTYKMDRGHRGANHPVKHLATGRIEITSQNHGFAVDAAGLPADLEVTHLSLFDGSVEGLRHKTYPIFSVQYHPESSPGPRDSRHLFAEFATLVRRVSDATS